MSHESKAIKDYRIFGEILKEFAPYRDLNSRQNQIIEDYLRDLDDSIARLAGHESLYSFATQNGFKNWDQMISENIDTTHF